MTLMRRIKLSIGRVHGDGFFEWKRQKWHLSAQKFRFSATKKTVVADDT